MSFIKLMNVSREYVSGDAVIKALDNISFDIEEGSFTLVLGPSGSGKTTTLNLLGGMDKATTGAILVGEKEISKFNRNKLTKFRRSDIGFVFQFYNIIPSLTAYENVDMAVRLNNSPISAMEAMEAVGLSKRIKNFPAQMSGGELQRVSIARALCKNPQLMLCDEPTGALDSVTGKKILTLLHSTAKKYNKTVIIVTHNTLLEPIADRVIKLKDGRIKQCVDNPSPISIDEVVW